MPQDNSATFLAGPAAFINANPICLSRLDEHLPAPGIPAVNNLLTRFTLYTNTVHGVPGPNDLPLLRMQPVGGPVFAPLPGGAVMPTMEALYCRAANGGVAFNNLPYVDIAIAPAALQPTLMFTTGMNGCTLVVASAVPAAAPALAAGDRRVMHDHDHRSLAQWAAAGYTLHFASYADAAQAGPVPPAWAPAPIATDYNPNNYAWGSPPPVVGPAGPIAMRVVTNFLWWDPATARWVYLSRHAHTYGIQDLAMDAPGAGPASTRVLPL